jgi:hypothetical protein
MSVAITSRPTITPRPTAPQLSRYVTELPQKIAHEQGREATLYSLASKVCLIAFLAIAAVALAISFGALPPLSAAITLPLLLSSFVFIERGQRFMMRSLECSDAAAQAKAKAQELALIRHWTTHEIKAFFEKHHLSLEKLPMDLLRQANPNAPLRALLPAIASYNYLCHKAEQHFKEHENNLYNRTENPILRHHGRLEGWKKLEFEAIPAALQAALVLQTISQPTQQLKLTDLGACTPKEFDQRRFDQLLEGSDAYFMFKDQARAPLTFTALQEIVSKQNYDGLRIKLFYTARG